MIKMKSSDKIVLLFFIFFLSCSASKKYSEICKNGDINTPERFHDCSYGSGNFGRWIVDEFGLPAYEYTLLQEKEDIALWWNSEHKERTEHWHQIGNSRISAAAYNYGYIQLFTQEGGFKWINYYDEDELNLGGGFSFIQNGEKIWSTAYKYRPENSKTTRTFGINYFFSEIEYDNIIVSRYVYTPDEDVPIILTDIKIENIGKTPVEISYYEYWDVNFHHIIPFLITSGLLDKSIPKQNEERRKKYNENFLQEAYVVGDLAVVRTYPKKTLTNSSPAEYDKNPPYVFLTYLDQWNDNIQNQGYIFDQSKFFQSGEPKIPSTSYEKLNEELRNVEGLGQKLALIHKRKIVVEPSKAINMRYAYGYTYNVDDMFIPQRYTEQNALEKVIDSWKKRLAYFATPSDSYLQREIAWHSYYILSSSYYRKYFDLHIVSQGGSYLFMHGYDGAPRDYCIFSVSLNYIDTKLSKEILKFIMMSTYKNGEIPYANYGDVVPARIDLVRPSDLDIFFLWALVEYVFSSRDFDFLNEKAPFYDSDANEESTVLDHIKVAFRHLFDVVGVGENGLIKFRTGDWSDGIRFFAQNIESLEKNGESGFNTAFAIAILPKVADMVRRFDRSFADEILKKTSELRSAFEKTWNGKWYLRGIEGNGKPLGDDRIFLEPQVWALIASLEENRMRTLIDSIRAYLETPLGAMIVYPPSDEVEKRTGLSLGTDVNGGIWPAINSLLTWAYSLYDNNLAWESFKKNTLANHAELYPNIWYGIWSGPDSYNSPKSSRPGEAAVQYATSLADFPVMNANSHANPILALVKIVGIDADSEGIKISPKIPSDFNLKLPYFGVKYVSDKIQGYYKAKNIGEKIKISVKTSKTPKEVRVNGKQVSFEISEKGEVSFTVELSDMLTWEIY